MNAEQMVRTLCESRKKVLEQGLKDALIEAEQRQVEQMPAEAKRAVATLRKLVLQEAAAIAVLAKHGLQWQNYNGGSVQTNLDRRSAQRTGAYRKYNPAIETVAKLRDEALVEVFGQTPAQAKPVIERLHKKLDSLAD